MDLLTTASLQQFVFGPYVVQVLVPDPVLVRRQWEEGPMTEGAFPYWAKAWPAAKALCMYLAAQPDLFRGKRVVELGAGLGLPSLLCAREAASVECTDHSVDALRFAEASAARTGLSVMRCAVLDWMTYPQPIPCDLLLLSDVNYDPAVGEALKALVDAYRKQHTQILLTTPQRPAGRAFAMDIAEWADRTVDVQVQDETGCVDISLFNIDSAGRDRSFTLA